MKNFLSKIKEKIVGLFKEKISKEEKQERERLLKERQQREEEEKEKEEERTKNKEKLEDRRKAMKAKRLQKKRGKKEDHQKAVKRADSLRKEQLDTEEQSKKTEEKLIHEKKIQEKILNIETVPIRFQGKVPVKILKKVSSTRFFSDKNKAFIDMKRVAVKEEPTCNIIVNVAYEASRGSVKGYTFTNWKCTGDAAIKNKQLEEK